MSVLALGIKSWFFLKGHKRLSSSAAPTPSIAFSIPESATILVLLLAIFTLATIIIRGFGCRSGPGERLGSVGIKRLIMYTGNPNFPASAKARKDLPVRGGPLKKYPRRLGRKQSQHVKM